MSDSHDDRHDDTGAPVLPSGPASRPVDAAKAGRRTSGGGLPGPLRQTVFYEVELVLETNDAEPRELHRAKQKLTVHFKGNWPQDTVVRSDFAVDCLGSRYKITGAQLPLPKRDPEGRDLVQRCVFHFAIAPAQVLDMGPERPLTKTYGIRPGSVTGV